MKNLIKYELCSIAGGASMDHIGDNIIITLLAEEAVKFNNCLFTWKCAYSDGGNSCRQLKPGEAYHGHHITHSIDSNAIAQYILTPAK